MMKEVLDEVYAGTNASEEDIDKILRAKFNELNKYRDGLSVGVCPNLKDDWVRLAFSYLYLATRTCQIEECIIFSLPRTFLTGDSIRIASIGCGPGTDLIGVIKARRKRNKNAAIHAHMFDREAGWEKTFNDLLMTSPELKQYMSIGPISTEWFALDLYDQNSWPFDDSYYNSDLFIMSYVLTEACKGTCNIPPFLYQIFEHSKPGAAFIFTDNNHHAFSKIYDEVKAAALKFGITLDFVPSIKPWYPSSEEQKDELIPYININRLNMRPLMQANFVAAVGIK